MAESRAAEIARLLQEGLDHYGADRQEEAVRCWRRVLELEPGHPEAHEYLQTALDDEPGAPAAEAGASEAAEAGLGAASLESLLEEAQRLLHGGALEEALELLETVAERDPERVEVHNYIDLARSRLLKSYRERLGTGVPCLGLASEQVLKFNLPPDAGFVLSRVDGQTNVKDLISVCGLDEFRTLRILVQMVEAGIVELRP